MSFRHHIQLIEKVDLQSRVWLTFWDLRKRVQVSFEANTFPARVGEVFVLDGSEGQLHVAPVSAYDRVDEKALLIPRKRHADPLQDWGELDVSLHESGRSPGAKSIYSDHL